MKQRSCSEPCRHGILPGEPPSIQQKVRRQRPSTEIGWGRCLSRALFDVSLTFAFQWEPRTCRYNRYRPPFDVG
ncbi:hypothetical protein Trydic_g1500 [Trypoxylus dichotomus]